MNSTRNKFPSATIATVAALLVFAVVASAAMITGDDIADAGRGDDTVHGDAGGDKLHAGGDPTA